MGRKNSNGSKGVRVIAVLLCPVSGLLCIIPLRFDTYLGTFYCDTFFVFIVNQLVNMLLFEQSGSLNNNCSTTLHYYLLFCLTASNLQGNYATQNVDLMHINKSTAIPRSVYAGTSDPGISCSLQRH